MIETEEALREATMSPDETVMRFKKLFGGEMTANERDIFPEPGISKTKAELVGFDLAPHSRFFCEKWGRPTLPAEGRTPSSASF
jgi:hypothetical protein